MVYIVCSNVCIVHYTGVWIPFSCEKYVNYVPKVEHTILYVYAARVLLRVMQRVLFLRSISIIRVVLPTVLRGDILYYTVTFPTTLYGCIMHVQGVVDE